MNIEDFGKVEKLVKIADRLCGAYAQLKREKVKYSEEDSGGVGEFDKGYHGVLSKHIDGSGSQIDLRGCYVGHLVLDEVQSVLEHQFEKVKTTLKELGVSVDGMEIMK